MSIVSVEVISDTQRGGTREIVYRCTDSIGGTHDYGPVLTIDADFDADAHKAVVEASVENALADAETRELLGD
jgi:hypothetical protein